MPDLRPNSRNLKKPADFSAGFLGRNGDRGSGYCLNGYKDLRKTSIKKPSGTQPGGGQ